MKKYLFLILALISSSAFATLQLGTDNVNTNDNRATSLSASTAFAAGGIGVGQGGASGATAASGGSSSGVNFEITSPKNTPAVFSGNVYPTAPCMGSSTVGGAGVGFGFSVGTSWKDDDCGIRETARSFQGMNMPADAMAVLCTSEYAKAAPSCKAMTAP